MEIWQFDLRRGNSDNPRAGACLLDAVSWFEYGTLGDHPACVCPIIATFARVVNDMLPDDRRQELKPLIPRLPGTVDPSAEKARAEFLMWQAVRVFAPAAFDVAASVLPAKDAAIFRRHATQMRGSQDKAAAVRAVADAVNAADAAAHAAHAAHAAAHVAHVARAAAVRAAAVRAAADAVNAAHAAHDAARAVAARAAAAHAVNAAHHAARAVADADADAVNAARAATEIFDLAIVALYDVLRIGKQAELIVPEQIERANRSFAFART